MMIFGRLCQCLAPSSCLARGAEMLVGIPGTMGLLCPVDITVEGCLQGQTQVFTVLARYSM